MVTHCQIRNYLHLETERCGEEEEEGKQAVSADTWLPQSWGTEPFPSLTRHSLNPYSPEILKLQCQLLG